jgi:hypothetical protein
VLKGDLYINNKISVLSKEICKEFGFDLWNKYFNIEMYKKQFDKLRKKFTYLHNF